MTQNNKAFSYNDGVDLQDLFESQIKTLHTLIEANDKNYNQRFESMNEVTKLALANADKATCKAEVATEKRLEGVNEWRRTYEDLTQGFITKSEFNAKWETIQQNRKDNTSLIIALLGITLAIASFIVNLL